MSSTDLVPWHTHTPAITINPGNPEKHAFAGGSFVNEDGIPTLIYNGLEAGACITTSTDDRLIHWKKSPANPVHPIPKKGSPDFGKYTMWDVCGWVDGDFHYRLSGGNPKEDGDVGWLFRSCDLVHWEFRHKFYKSDRKWTGPEEDCSCPDFFPIGKKHMLMFISHTRGLPYYIGTYKDETFYPEKHGRMNWPGGPTFAQDRLVDAKGRRIFWIWVPDQRTRQAIRLNGWSGVYAMPRVISLAEDDTVLVEPVEEMSQIQALDRTPPGLPLKKGCCGTRTHDDVRHGITTLFAALDVLEGKVIGQCLPRHRQQEFCKFLRTLDASYPKTLALHLISDNYDYAAPSAAAPVPQLSALAWRRAGGSLRARPEPPPVVLGTFPVTRKLPYLIMRRSTSTPSPSRIGLFHLYRRREPEALTTARPAAPSQIRILKS